MLRMHTFRVISILHDLVLHLIQYMAWRALRMVATAYIRPDVDQKVAFLRAVSSCSHPCQDVLLQH